MPRHAKKRIKRTAGAPPRAPRPRRRFRWARLVLLAFTLSCLFVLAACADIVYHAVSAVPALSDPANEIGTSSQIFDRNGQFLTIVPGTENHQPLDITQIPQQLQDAFIATEDRTFYSNIGVSFRGIARAALADITHHAFLQGASTISQQVARIHYLNRRDTLTRKLEEAVLAIELNHRYTKPQILAMYLNDVYLGEHAYGVEAASITYFNQPDLSKLTLAQMALLAGLPQAPSSYDPFLDPKAAKTRRNEVLQSMVAAGYITQDQAAAAAAEPVTVTRGTGSGQAVNYPAPWFVDAVIRQLEQPPFNLTEQQIQGGGLKIYTTLDPKIQAAADQAVKTHMQALPHGMETGVAVMDQHTGDVVAIVGGVEHSGQFTLDRAIDIHRQPGSSAKPLVDYIPALESGMTAGTVVDDVPTSYPAGNGGQYIPQDDVPPYYGLTTLTEALRRSVNTVATAVLWRIGVQKGFDNAVAMGLPLSKDDKNLALAIGGLSGKTCCSPLDMADAYSTIANGGMHVTPRLVTKVLGPGGEVLVNNPVQFKQVVDPKIAFVMTKMLQTVNNPQPDNGWDSNWGTGYDQQVQDNVPGWPSAGKTGTTEDNRDAWFVGFTPLYTAAVWLGYDQPKQLQGLYGGVYAGPIWKDIMVAAVAGHPVQDFPQPQGVVQAPIDVKCAEWSVCSPGPLTPPQWIRNEWFVAGTQPTPATSHNIWVQVQVTQSDPQLLWDPTCGGTPVTAVRLNRKPLGLDWAQPIAAYFGWRQSASDFLPVDGTDPSLALPRQSCAGAAAGGAGGGGQQGGGQSQNGCGASWQVSVAGGRPASPAVVCIYQGQTAHLTFASSDGRRHQLLLQGLGQRAVLPADGTPATVDVTAQQAGETLILLDGAPVGRLQVQVPPGAAGDQNQ